VSGSPAGRRVLVVGGGLAGLVAAHRLHTAGARVSVVEARTRAGGKLAGAAAQPAADAPWVLPRHAPALWGLVGGLGLEAQVARVELDALGTPTRRGAIAARPLRTRAFLARHPLRGLQLRRLQVVLEWLAAAVDPEHPDRETRLDDRSVADLCRLYPGRRPLQLLFAPLLELGFGLDAADASRQLLLACCGAGGDPELDLACGLGRLAGALAGRLPELRTDRRVLALLPGGRGARLAGGECVDAEAVVLAVAPDEVLRLAPDLTFAERALLERFAAVRGLRVALELEPVHGALPRALWLPEARGGALAGALDAAPAGSDRRWTALVARRDHAEALSARDDAQIVERLLREARRACPALTARAAHVQRLNTPAFRPGQLRGVGRLRDEAHKHPGRRLFLCGDYLVGPHAAGEVAAGERAAREVLRALTCA
jgi:oxygen-dependent protoporphyrinogen oxidase